MEESQEFLSGLVSESTGGTESANKGTKSEKDQSNSRSSNLANNASNTSNNLRRSLLNLAKDNKRHEKRLKETIHRSSQQFRRNLQNDSTLQADDPLYHFADGVEAMERVVISTYAHVNASINLLLSNIDERYTNLLEIASETAMWQEEISNVEITLRDDIARMEKAISEFEGKLSDYSNEKPQVNCVTPKLFVCGLIVLLVCIASLLLISKII